MSDAALNTVVMQDCLDRWQAGDRAAADELLRLAGGRLRRLDPVPRGGGPAPGGGAGGGRAGVLPRLDAGADRRAVRSGRADHPPPLGGRRRETTGSHWRLNPRLTPAPAGRLAV